MRLTATNGLSRILSGQAGRFVRFIRYSVGSAAATGVSAVVFALAYHVPRVGPEVSSLAAFLSGALVNFAVSRLWTWRGPHRRRMGRDAVGFGVIAVSTAIAAAVATGVAEGYARRAGMTATGRAVLVEGAYFFVYGVMFLIKFTLLDRVVFRYQHAPSAVVPRSPVPRSPVPRSPAPSSPELVHASGTDDPATP